MGEIEISLPYFYMRKRRKILKLSDYLRVKRENSKFYGDYAYLNSVKIPTPPLIWSHQKRVFKQMHGINDISYQSSPIMKDLQNDLIGKTTINDFSNIVNKNIKNIEKHIQVLNRNSVEAIMNEADKQLNIKSLDAFIMDYMAFINKLKDMKSFKEIEFAIKPLEGRLQFFQNVALQVSEGEKPPQGSLYKKINWTEYILKGRYLEEEGTNFFKEKLPQNLVLNTGNIKGYYDIGGSFKNSGSMKEDIMIFNDPNFTVSFTIGKDKEKKTMTIQNFIDFVENSSEKKSIRLTQEGYDNLLRNTISAIQAKATRTQHIKFGNINIRTAQRELQGEALLSLKNLYQEQMKITEYTTKKGNIAKRRTSVIVGYHKDYDALFNYNLARNITHVIGKNNLLLTRNGIIDMYTYVMEQFEKGKYFYGINVNLPDNKGNKIVL